MAELRVKLDRPLTSQDNRQRDYNSSTASQSSQGFAGILGTRRSFESARREREPIEPRPEPVAMPEDDGQYIYDGYYGAQVSDYDESAPVEPPYPAGRPQVSQRYLPPPVSLDNRQSMGAPAGGLMSESSSAATQAAFDQLADTITRRALGDRPITDIAHELLRGMLKEWLDNNLPKIVERLVREEIERVVRRPQR
ncbi:PopZ family protein [Taklimakanibacter lacteus]|uniref:PopZ family protein n=1 Tax=Taklimakanibacter lacteus TaxID=2268456 RepID=UPI0034D60BF1